MKAKNDSGKNMLEQVELKESRRLKAKREGKRSIWFGFGMSGLIGWSVAVPTLIGAAIGLWIDKKNPGAYSWTLMLLMAGLLTGCVIAWRWVNKENREMNESKENKS